MKITWIGHSCFKIEKNDYSLLIDPYTTGSVPGLAAVADCANEILCSHEHGDHSGREEVKLIETGEHPFEVEVLPTYHDEVQGAKRGENKIHIIDDGEYRIAHLGDLGCHPTEEQMEKLSGLDAVLIPVGGFYTIDGNEAAELISELDPGMVIPMHFRDDAAGFGYQEISTVEVFTKHFEQVHFAESSEVELGEEPAEQVVVLHPKRGERCGN